MIVRRTEIAIYADKKHGLEMPQLADVPQPSAELLERCRALAEGRGKQGFSLAGRAEASIWMICFTDGFNALLIFNRLMRFSVPCVLFSVVFFSGEAWARVGRLLCKSGGCDNPIFASLLIILGSIFIAGPFFPPLWRFLGDEDGPAWKVIAVIMGVIQVGFGIWLFG